MRSPLYTVLAEHIKQQLLHSSSSPSGSSCDLTVGVEHEFFLLDSDYRPATHELGQLFLRKLAETDGWAIRIQGHDTLGKMIQRVSREQSAGRYTAIKYDHHPHLFEIAMGYERNVADLGATLRTTWDALLEAAHAAGASIHSKPFLPISTQDASVVSPLKEFRRLRHYRAKLYELRGQTPDREHVNYAAVIAATQTHIGGTAWWHLEDLIERIYSREPEMLYWSALGVTTNLSRMQQLIRARWSGYKEVFQGYPLIGFPQIPRWTLDSWIMALLDSPLAGGDNDDWAGRTLAQLGRSPLRDLNETLSAIRDLQIIRPRLFGTLEFRADPAQPDVDSILALVACRLGLVAYEMAAPRALNYEKASREWWKAVDSGDAVHSERLLKDVVKGLASRGLGEESFVDRLSLIDRVARGAL